MATITTRADNGSPLTNTQVDANFTNLNDDKQEILAEGAFVDGDKTKLDGIESGATADQTAGEIKTAYESNADTNAFTDAEQTKLSGIEASADVTDTANVTAAGALMDSELTDIAAVKALNQGVSTTDEPTFENTLLSAIDTTIADTAVDIFIYDTRKDSDGGAWRKRTQHTSWYNETLNTATRGSRREFPAVAVIVAESNQVTIYDGDDPDMPMWMVFESNTDDLFRSIGGNAPLFAQNGILLVGTSSNASGLCKANFVGDTGFRYRDSGSAANKGDYLGSLSQRNSASGFSGNSTYDANLEIVDDTVNDVDMTVLPNAPIDSATGLPIPTIAVATDAGVSVIKDDGTVVDITTTTESDTVDAIAFLSDTQIQVNLVSFSAVLNIPSLDVSNTYWILLSNYSHRFLSGAEAGSLNTVGSTTGYVKGAISSASGLTKVAETSSNPSSDMVNYITSSYNTGWMNGDIKLATLSDTDDTDVTGSELVTNGDMSSSTGWTLGSGFTIGSGILTGSSVSNFLIASAPITTINGQVYVASIDCLTKSAGSFRLYYHNGSGYVTYVELSGGETATLTFTASSTSGSLRVYSYNGPSSGTFDNLTCRLAEEDRSVNNNGLQVFGTVTKNPVATGADLVAYSGFTSSRYLEQPYNSDFNFGTGDFAFIWWMDSPTASQDNIVWGLGDYSAPNGLGCLALNSSGSGDSLLLHFEGSDVNSSVYVEGHEEAGWICVAMVRRSGVLYSYRNGELQGTSSTATGSFSLASETIQTLNLGAGYSGGSVFSNGFNGGKLSLFRISATAPSPEQIKKIYEDEKVLFQENAEATLYGSSDSVTALAYDDSTDLLHAGTSAGRSVFQGLRRVDNTTDAVGSAISASNGMVADD